MTHLLFKITLIHQLHEEAYYTQLLVFLMKRCTKIILKLLLELTSYFQPHKEQFTSADIPHCHTQTVSIHNPVEHKKP